MNGFRELFVRNPMLLSPKAVVQKYFPQTSKTLNWAVACGIAILYLLFLTLSVANDAWPDLSTILHIMLVILIFLIPAMLHGAIAGEREKRTWDFLACAPITSAQIVMGKFMSAVMAMLGVVILAIPYLAHGISEFLKYDPGYDPYHQTYHPELGRALGAIGIVFGYGLFLSALSLFISGRTRRAFTAHGIILGVQALYLFVYWFLTNQIFGEYGSNSGMPRLEMAIHPFTQLANAIFATPSSVVYDYIIMKPWFTCMSYAVLSGLLLFWTIKTLMYADRLPPFVPKKQDA